MNARRPARLNRTLLTLLGLVLLAVGAAAAAVGLGLLAVPGLDPAVPLLPAEIALAPWVPYVVIAAAVVVGLLALRWLAAQLARRPRGATWRTGDPARGTTSIASATAATAAAAEIAGYPGVQKATADLSGPRERPTLHLVVTVAQDTPTGPLRWRITDHAVPRLRAALEIDDLPSELLLHVGTTRTDRTTRIR